MFIRHKIDNGVKLNESKHIPTASSAHYSYIAEVRMSPLVVGIIVNALSLTFLCFELWLFGNRMLKELPGFLLFGMVVGAALTMLLA